MTDENPILKKTIFIGVGGAGRLILTHIKRLFKDRFGVLPPSIKLYSIDTDDDTVRIRSSLSEKSHYLSVNEKLHLNVPTPTHFIEADPIVKGWYVLPAPAGAINKGAGAVRQNGRLGLFQHIGEFVNHVDKLQEQLNSMRLPAQMGRTAMNMGAHTDFKLADKDVEAFVCGSLAGGTGSGTFLDVGIILRDMMPNALIHGFFLMDWVYRHKAFAYRVSGNTYAALSELDNMQSLKFGDKNFVPYQMTYTKANPVMVKKHPYDLINLVDGRNEYGENIHEVDDLCETVATAIFLSIGPMAPRIRSVADNLMQHVHVSPPRVWKGKYARYSSFGVSSIYYPAEELHRMLSLECALDLCSNALKYAQKARDDTKAQQDRMQRILQDVQSFLGKGNLDLLNKGRLRDRVCPDRKSAPFAFKEVDLKDKKFPKKIEQGYDRVEKAQETAVQNSYNNNNQIHLNAANDSLNKKIQDIEADSLVGVTYMQQWIQSAVDELRHQSKGARNDENNALQQAQNHKKNADGIIQNAKKIGGTFGRHKRRKELMGQWLQEKRLQLNAALESGRFHYLKKFYDNIIKESHSKKPEGSGDITDAVGALLKAKQAIEALIREEQANLEVLKDKPNQVLLGNGNLVVVPDKDKRLLNGEEIRLPYRQFRVKHEGGDPQYYLSVFKESPKKLTDLFLEWSREKLEYIKGITVEDALKTIGENQGDKDAYITAQFDHLLRMSAALWSYNESRMTIKQREQYANIVNLGVYDQDEGMKKYNKYIEKVKKRHRITKDHSYSTTRERHRIWLLNYAAALPAYLLTGLEEKKTIYEEEITPTYHSDQYLELEVPDLFPEKDVSNRALRILGMAIVPGIDVIRDEKLSRGHKFTLDDPEIRDINYGDPMEWELFRKMYRDVVDDYPEEGEKKEKDRTYLLDRLKELLITKVNSLTPDERRKNISKYIRMVKQKMDDRDFTRLISARLTYREIKELKKFIRKPVEGPSYNLDIEAYIGGKLQEAGRKSR